MLLPSLCAPRRPRRRRTLLSPSSPDVLPESHFLPSRTTLSSTSLGLAALRSFERAFFYPLLPFFPPLFFFSVLLLVSPLSRMTRRPRMPCLYIRSIPSRAMREREGVLLMRRQGPTDACLLRPTTRPTWSRSLFSPSSHTHVQRQRLRFVAAHRRRGALCAPLLPLRDGVKVRVFYQPTFQLVPAGRVVHGDGAHHQQHMCLAPFAAEDTTLLGPSSRLWMPSPARGPLPGSSHRAEGFHRPGWARTGPKIPSPALLLAGPLPSAGKGSPSRARSRDAGGAGEEEDRRARAARQRMRGTRFIRSRFSTDSRVEDGMCARLARPSR